MLNTTLLSNWKNWVRVTLMLLIGFYAAYVVSGFFTNSEDEE